MYHNTCIYIYIYIYICIIIYSSNNPASLWWSSQSGVAVASTTKSTA